MPEEREPIKESQAPLSDFDETQERIVQAATRVISDVGYARATTRAIAAEAGVNEVTIFRRFGNKKNLLMAVAYRNSARPELEEALKSQFSGNYRQDLLNLGNGFLAMMAQHRKAILMSLCEAQRSTDVREVIAQSPLQQRHLLGKYLRRQIQLGVVRELQYPEIVAQAFFGALFEYSISQTLFEERPDEASPEEIVAQLVEVFLEGTIAKSEQA
jgi:AcrR family transcriptional regulator